MIIQLQLHPLKSRYLLKTDSNSMPRWIYSQTLIKKISIKRTFIKRTVRKRTLFSCIKWKICLYQLSVKSAQDLKNIFSERSTHNFLLKLLLRTICNSLFHTVNNISLNFSLPHWQLFPVQNTCTTPGLLFCNQLLNLYTFQWL